MTMLEVSIAEAKAKLAELLKKVEAGEQVVLTRRNRPVVELRRISERQSGPRPYGLCRGEFVLPEDFNDPLPEDMLDAFNGQ